jgi:hypothetical protein
MATWKKVALEDSKLTEANFPATLTGDELEISSNVVAGGGNSGSIDAEVHGNSSYIGGYNNRTWSIEIDSVGTPDTFKWKDSVTDVWTENVDVSGGIQTLNYGLKIIFTATTGAVLGDNWSITTTLGEITVEFEEPDEDSTITIPQGQTGELCVNGGTQLWETSGHITSGGQLGCSSLKVNPGQSADPTIFFEGATPSDQVYLSAITSNMSGLTVNVLQSTGGTLAYLTDITAAIPTLHDDDTLSNASATTVASDESIKTYVDAENGTQDTTIASKLTHVSEDSSPSLGGNLNTMSHSILLSGDDASGDYIGHVSESQQDKYLNIRSINGGAGDAYMNINASTIWLNGQIDAANSTAIIDDDTMATAIDNKLATSSSIKAYADTMLPLAGGTMTGLLDMGDKRINHINRIDFEAGGSASDIHDEDDMASDSAFALATQQSIKAYADTKSIGWHGSETRVKILPSDFMKNGDWSRGNLTMRMPDTLKPVSFSTDNDNLEAFAMVPIPTGYKATKFILKGNDSNNRVYAWEACVLGCTAIELFDDAWNSTAANLMTVNTEHTFDTQLTSNASNYLIVWWESEDGAGIGIDLLYGGWATIEVA